MVGIDSKVLIRVTNKWGRLGRITQIIRNSAGTIIKYEVTMEPDGMDPEKIMMPVADAVDRNTVWQAYRMNLMCDPKHDLMITYERDDGVKCWCRGESAEQLVLVIQDAEPPYLGSNALETVCPPQGLQLDMFCCYQVQ